MKLDRDETRAHEHGEQAAMGRRWDGCPYRNHDLRAHWLRGWHAWHRDNPPSLSEDERRAGRECLARIKSILKQLP
ncbi:MAG: ribosome modulation factor [Pseudomonadota bacterium]